MYHTAELDILMRQTDRKVILKPYYMGGHANRNMAIYVLELLTTNLVWLVGFEEF